MMKVLVISHTYITPINRSKWKVLTQHNTDLSLTVVMPHQWPAHFFTIKASTPAEENSSNCQFISINARLCGNEVLYFYSFTALLKLLKNLQPDVIHVEQGLNALSYLQVILLAKLLRLKCKFTFFTWINWEEPAKSLSRKLVWPLLEKIAIKNSHGAIAGNLDAKKILEKKGIKTVTVLPQLGVDTTCFRPARAAQSTSGKHYIGYVGRITEEKGVLLLARVFAGLAQEFPNWNLLIVGAGPHEKTIIDFVLHKKLLDRVEFKAPVSHEKIAPIMQSLDLLVLPSYDTPFWREQFGHVLIEAMACKVPVIGSTGGEIPQVIAGAGLIFEQENEESLRTALCKLMRSAALRAELGEKGYQRTLHHYTHEAIAAQTVTFWHTLP